MIERSRVRLPAGELPGNLDQLSLSSPGVGKSSTSLLAAVKAGRVQIISATLSTRSLTQF